MSITPQFLDQLRDRVPLSEVVGRFVSWDQKKSRPAQGDYWAPCPFHTEKTASFHADDRKGFYYCFGCHQKGDAIGFLREKANLGFVEAVRELAGMAGVEMPAMDPGEKQKADAHAKFVQMHERAAKFFTLQLNMNAGVQAKEYLHKKRNLSDETIKTFGIGFVPNGRDLLLNHLREGGFSDEEILTAGLALKPDDGGALFDRFRNRIMFPIHDARGRVIAFGGRAMDPNAKAKYLNSSETPIFHKGRVVYNFHRARSHFDDEGRFILVEGYMDVIALWQAGIRTALAPLGTAVTLEQLRMLWRIDRAPVIALDGDEAGIRAMTRVANLVLPDISADRSVRFAQLPAGKDPDDLIYSEGASGMRAVIKSARPLVDVLWEEALGRDDLETPEARAAFDAKLKAFANEITDTSLKAHYLVEFRERRKALWQSGEEGKLKHKAPKAKGVIHFSPKAHQDFRVALILRTIFAHPELAKNFTDELSQISCPNPKLDHLRKEVVLAYGEPNALKHLASEENLKLLEFGDILKNLRWLGEDGDALKALDVASDEIARITAQSRARDEIQHIYHDLQNQDLTEEMEALLKNAVIMRDEATKIIDDRMDDDEDKRAFLRQFLESERWRK